MSGGNMSRGNVRISPTVRTTIIVIIVISISSLIIMLLKNFLHVLLSRYKNVSTSIGPTQFLISSTV